MNTPNRLTLLRLALFIPLLAVMIAALVLWFDGSRAPFLNYRYFDLNTFIDAIPNNQTATPALMAVYTLTHEKALKAAALFLSLGFIFTFAMFTDFLDGYLARKNKQITTFGKLFDPLADKIMTSTMLIFLSILQFVPFYFVIIFIVRDIVVDGMRNFAAANQIEVAAGKLGKVKTLLQSIGIAIIIFAAPALANADSSVSISFYNPSWHWWVLNIPLIAATVLALGSAYQYFKPIKPLLRFK